MVLHGITSHKDPFMNSTNFKLGLDAQPKLEVRGIWLTDSTGGPGWAGKMDSMRLAQMPPL